jgi:hypothetical protein
MTTDNHKTQLEVTVVDSTQAGFASVGNNSDAMEKRVGAAADKASASVDKIGEAAKQSGNEVAQAAGKVATEVSKVSQSMGSMTDALKRNGDKVAAGLDQATAEAAKRAASAAAAAASSAARLAESGASTIAKLAQQEALASATSAAASENASRLRAVADAAAARAEETAANAAERAGARKINSRDKVANAIVRAAQTEAAEAQRVAQIAESAARKGEVAAESAAQQQVLASAKATAAMRSAAQLAADASAKEVAAQQAAAEAARASAAVFENAAQRKARAAAIAAGETAKANQQVSRSEAAFVANVQRTALEIEAGGRGTSRYFEVRAKQLGLDSEAVRGNIIALKEMEAAQARARAQMGDMGLSAKQLTASMRGVPAQMTDIVTSLQGGQAPLTVFIQQGGQLKDVFGGASNAAKALGGYVLGLVTPLSVAAVALGVVAYAYKSGLDDIDALNAAVTGTGRAAGYSSSSLRDLANVMASDGFTHSAVSKALGSIAGSGVVAHDSVQRFTQTAIDMERYAGGSVDKMVEGFKKLADEPAKASLELTKSLGYLTAAQYEEIKSLEDQGRHLEAVAKAQGLYDDRMRQSADAAKANVGAIGLAMDFWRAKAVGFWNAVSGAFMPDTGAQRLAKLKGELAQLTGAQATSLGGVVKGWASDGFSSDSSDTTRAQRIAALREQVRVLELTTKATEDNAKWEAKRQQQQEAGFAISAEVAGDLDKGNKLKEHETRIRNLGAAAGWDEQRINGAIAQARKKANIETQGAINAASNELAAIRAKITETELETVALRTQTATSSRQSEADKLALKLTQELAGSLDAKTAAHVRQELALAKEWQRKTDLLDLEKAAQASTKATIDAITTSSQGIKQRADALEAENESWGKSRAAIEREVLAVMKLKQALAGPVQPGVAAAVQELVDQQERLTLATTAAEYKVSEGIAEWARATDDLAASQRDEFALVGLTGTARAKVVAIRATELKLAKELADIDRLPAATNEVEYWKQEGMRLKARTTAEKEAALAVAKVNQDAWDATGKKISDDLYSAIMDGGGKGFKKLLTDVKDWFAHLVLQPIISPISNFAASVLNPGAAGGGGLGSLSNLSSLSNLASGFTSAVGSMTGGIASAIGSAGSLFGSEALSSFAVGMKGATLAPGLMGPTTAGATGATGLGASVGAAMPWMAGAAGGIGLGTLISGGHSIFGDGHSSTAVLAGTVGGAALGMTLGSIGGPLGMLIGGAIGGVLNAAFGRGKTKVTGSGISGTFGADGFAGSSYTDYKQSGGWFTSSRTWQDRAGLSPETLSTMSGSFLAVRTSVLGMSAALGLTADGVKKYTKDVNIAASTSNEDIAKIFAGISDEMAALAAGASTLAGFANSGETSTATMSRLATSLTVVNTRLSLTNQRAFGISLSGAAMASSLADAMGGLDTFTTASKSFYDLFFDENHKIADSQAELSKALAVVNLQLPSSKAAFRDVAASLDLSTASGQAAYSVLLAIAPQYAQTADAVAAQTTKLAEDLTQKLMAAYTGKGQLVPALDLASTGAQLAAASLRTVSGAPVSSSIKDVNTYLASISGLPVGVTMDQVNAYLKGVAALPVGTSIKDVNDYLAGLKPMPVGVTMSQVNAYLAGVQALPVGTSIKDVNTYLASVDAAPVGVQFAQINSVLTDAGSRTLTVVAGIASTARPLDASQLAAAHLYEQLDKLALQADRSVVNVSALATALAGVNTETFMTTVAAVFDKLAQRISTVIGSIKTEREAVTNAALQIVNPTTMSKDQIARGIASVNTSLPSNAAVLAANTALSQADAARAQKAASYAPQLADAAANVTKYTKNFSDWLVKYKSEAADFVKLQEKYGVYANANTGDSTARTGLQYNDTTGKFSGYTQTTYYDANAVSAFKADTAVAALVSDLKQANGDLSRISGNVMAANSWLTFVKGNAAAADTAQQALVKAAEETARKATLDFTNALQAFSIDAGKSVGKLTRLREETVKYYDQQKALQTLMTSSADSLRKTVADYRYSTLSPQQQLESLQSQFSSAYSMALVTSGDTLAGYGTTLNSLMSPLLQKAQEVMGGDAYKSFSETLIARSEAVATRLEDLAPKDFQAESLDLLGQIDSTLALLDDSTSSAEAMIVAAVNASKDKTAEGLRAVVSALTGKPVTPFATGGAFTNGVVSRPTSFNPAVMGEAGAEGILPLANVGGRLGVYARSSENTALAQAVQRLAGEVADLRAENRAAQGQIATNTRRSADLHDQWQRNGLAVTADTSDTTF